MNHRALQELEVLRQKHAAAEAQAQEEAEALQEEIKKREELERLQKELENLLETERLAKEEEAKAKALQEQLLVQEKKRLEELERLKAEKEQLLDMEKKSREDLEEKHREKERLLEEVRRIFLFSFSYSNLCTFRVPVNLSLKHLRKLKYEVPPFFRASKLMNFSCCVYESCPYKMLNFRARSPIFVKRK